MKIGIITFWWSNDNYGQLLQCYALQRYLKNLGHEPFLIRYKCTDDILPCKNFEKLRLSYICTYFRNRLSSLLKKQTRKYTNRHFDEFRQMYINYSDRIYRSFDELKSSNIDVDMLIVGSDQVWNNWNYPLYRFKNRIHACFLDFASEKTKRLSYSASWGITDLTDEYIAEITPLLKKFDYVSVREKSGINLCKQCGCDDAEWVCDPTLLLSADDYRKIYNGVNFYKRENKYLFLYILNNNCKFNYQIISNFARKKHLDIVYITGNRMNDKYTKIEASIPEWLYLLDNAEYVITNSFHCGVFSTIFHKKFGIVPLEGNLSQANSRIDSLFELRGIGNRYIKDNDFSILDQEYYINDINISKKFKSFFCNN